MLLWLTFVVADFSLPLIHIKLKVNYFPLVFLLLLLFVYQKWVIPSKMCTGVQWSVVMEDRALQDVLALTFPGHTLTPQSGQCNPEATLSWYKPLVPAPECRKCVGKHICGYSEGRWASAQMEPRQRRVTLCWSGQDETGDGRGWREGGTEVVLGKGKMEGPWSVRKIGLGRGAGLA